MQKTFLPTLLISLGLVGCVSSSITNLTPSRMERNSTGVYPIEMAWATRQHAQLPQSLQPKVQAGLQEVPMQRTLIVTNRWEAMVSIPANEKALHYRFKVDYETQLVKTKKKDSKLSKEYILEIVDKK